MRALASMDYAEMGISLHDKGDGNTEVRLSATSYVYNPRLFESLMQDCSDNHQSIISNDPTMTYAYYI